MGYRVGRKPRRRLSRSDEYRTLLLIVVIAAVPVIGVVWAVSSTSQPDLSDLSPLQEQGGKYTILGWSRLRRDRPNVSNSSSTLSSGALIQILGYMTDGVRPTVEGELSKSFIIMPEAGNFLHPGHRRGDQMIVVHLRQRDLIKFTPNVLVRVWGTFRNSPGNSDSSGPLYSLDDARAELALKRDLHTYF